MKTCRLNIQGFKCFNESEFELKNLTVLCGSNGAGKSSAVQALLLARLAVEKNAIAEGPNYDLSQWSHRPVPLNGEYELTLGVLDEIANEHHFKVTVGNSGFVIADGSGENIAADSLDSLIMLCEGGGADEEFITKKEFYYLNAERIGPRYILEYQSSDFLSCGHRGENTARVYSECYKARKKTDASRSYEEQSSSAFEMQVDAWLGYICPGISIRVESRGNLNGQIFIRNARNAITSAATQIGFGISYLLPIIITGLIAEAGAMFVIENPEAHLHPQAQSRLGYFIGKVAASGVRVLVETHSEHIVNGIRRAALTDGVTLDTEDVVVYFFKGFVGGGIDCETIRIEPTGDLSSFPVDFFDQTRQDLLEILKLSRH